MRDENDGKLRLKELKGLENGPGRKVNVSEVSDDVSMELADFAKFFAEGPVLEGFRVRTDPPVVQNDRYYFYGAYIEDAEQQSPFDLVVLKAVRGGDGKLRLLYFKPYGL
ncbi:MAG: hypothetical protein J6X14_02800 [Lachnospiraceae bacterium]|nr:hypothetical protein [Lachnospiraceae bacterium]